MNAHAFHGLTGPGQAAPLLLQLLPAPLLPPLPDPPLLVPPPGVVKETLLAACCLAKRFVGEMGVAEAVVAACMSDSGSTRPMSTLEN